MAAVHDELRRIAARYLSHERRDHTLQPTALVHEAYLRLMDEKRVLWQNRAHFLGIASLLMRRILVDHARTHRAGKRGGGMPLIQLDEALAGSLVTGESVSAPAEQIGPYRIVATLGRGGMGSVYRAVRVDGEFSRTVAIKVVRQGMESDYWLRRFLAERQILANLDHRNIARLLDGGATDNGLPYIVMEYVEGTPIDRYCDQAKLATEARLRLFLAVCSAVDFAHRNLIVHRDIKPGNILVTGDGVPKLLDFGIAKLLSPDPGLTAAEQTVTAMRMMTPDFAIPEQVRGEAVTTATDVYSLGVLLYVLMTGHRPYRVTSGTPEELVRMVCEAEPERPSAVIARVEVERRGDATVEITPDSVSRTRDGDPKRLRRALRGDLDNILLMTMQKEPERRYGSVRALSDDIARYLNGEPVRAHAATWRYVLGKNLRKHRRAVAASALAVLAILALSGLWLRTRWQTLEKVRVAQEMAQEMEQNESMLRSAYLAPLHDTRREREQVRQWIRNTQTRVQSMRDASRLMGEYVLGVGLLSLDDNREARTHLESAWHSGYRSPDAACALGLALVRLYNDEKKEVDTIRSRELRETKHRQLLAEYRDPALMYLHEGAGASHVPREYVEGLIAYLENRYDECLEKCSAAMTRVPWFYQAKILEGDVYLSRGNQKRDAGDREGAMTEYEMADQAYRLAARVGESDPLTYARIATVWKLAIFSELYGAGKDMSLNRQRALDPASDALRADPENADVHILIANVCRLWSASEVRGGRDPGEWLARSFDSARTALRFRPMEAEALVVASPPRA